MGGQPDSRAQTEMIVMFIFKECYILLSAGRVSTDLWRRPDGDALLVSHRQRAATMADHRGIGDARFERGSVGAGRLQRQSGCG